MKITGGSKLIIVEGLTGSGKSMMAHFLARQLNHNGIAASWVHEGEVPHPFLIDMDAGIEAYMAETYTNWVAFVQQMETSADVCIIEASFFNNLLETLMAHQVERETILHYADELTAVSQALKPTLVYLVQKNVAQAMERNFNRRGPGFREFVIQLAASKPLSQANGWEGLAGMLRYWQAFVSLTDELYLRFPGRKIKIDNSAGDWEAYNQRVLNHLAIPRIREQRVLPAEAQSLIGTYRDPRSGKEFAVRSEDGELSINLFLEVWTRLVRRSRNGFEAEGWPFEICFEPDDLKSVRRMRIDGRDVDYLPLVGTMAEKVSA